MSINYRLQFWDKRKNALAINWAKDRVDYVEGDCRVRAILGSTDVEEHNKNHFQRQEYSEPMTLEQARDYIKVNTARLGEVHDCVGLTLEDACFNSDFAKPVEVRNMKDLFSEGEISVH